MSLVVSNPREHTTAEEEECEQLLASLQDCNDPTEARRTRERVIELNLYLADSVASRYRNRGIDTDDLVQVGRLGLVKAVSRYEPQPRPTPFAAYAVPTIAGEIKRHFRDRGWMIRPPRRLQELRAAAISMEAELAQTEGCRPSASQLATALDVSVSELLEAQTAEVFYRPLSLDAPTRSTDGGDGDDLGGLIATGADDYDSVDTHDALSRAIQRLTPRQQQLLHLRFVDERTQSEIGSVMGVSQMQVSRLLSRAMDDLRGMLLDPELPVASGM
jgi:RNA polymerase sigma-B factor